MAATAAKPTAGQSVSFAATRYVLSASRLLLVATLRGKCQLKVNRSYTGDFVITPRRIPANAEQVWRDIPWLLC